MDSMIDKAEHDPLCDEYRDISSETVESIMHARALRKDPDLLAKEDGYKFNVSTTTKEERRRALEDSCQYVDDHDWVEETADLVAFNYHVVAVTLGIVGKDQVSIAPEKIVELRKINDPEERRLATLAALKEVQDLCDIGTLELVERDRAANEKVIGSKLVLKAKYRADGAYERHKARIVALGYQQRLGQDFFATFSPMATLTTVRAMISDAVQQGNPIWHADVPSAFLHADLPQKERMAFRLPVGFNVDGLTSKTMLRLVKSIYGLKQSPQAFHKLLNSFLCSNVLGFTATHADSCLFCWRKGDDYVHISSEVDDLVITGNCNWKIDEIQSELQKRFSINGGKFVFEPISSFMGIDIDYDQEARICTFGMGYKIDKLFKDHPFLDKLGRDSTIPSAASDEKPSGNSDKVALFFEEYGHHCNVTMTQEELAQKRSLLGVGYGIFNVVKSGFKFASDQKLDSYLLDHYRSIVGSLIYMMITCRPDLCFAVGKLSRQMHAPSPIAIEWLKRCLRYLKGSMDDKLRFTGREDSPAAAMFNTVSAGRANPFSMLCGFTDSDHASAREAERRSISGFCYFLHGNLITWKSKVQPITAGSTHEAELIALSFCCDEGLWLRNLLLEAQFAQKLEGPIPIMCDNQGTVFTAHNPVINSNSKLLDIRYFRVRQHINARLVDVLFCRTTENLADFFTKSLAFPQFDKFRNIIMNSDRQYRLEWAKKGKEIRDMQQRG